MGGFARRMSYWNAFAKKYPSIPALRLDGGSVFSSGAAEAPVVNKWMLEGTYKSRLDAVNLSAWDLSVWQELADLASAGQVPKEHLNVPLISANVSPKVPNFPTVQRYVIREFDLGAGAPRQKLRVGVTGILFDPEERISRREFQIQDPVVAVRRVIDEMRSSTDYRVVLTDMDIGKAISLAIVVPSIHLLGVSHNYDLISEPHQVGDSLIVLPVNEGRMISEVRVVLAAGSEKVTFESRFVPLDRTVPDETAMGQLVRQAQSDLDKFRHSMKAPGF